MALRHRAAGHQTGQLSPHCRGIIVSFAFANGDLVQRTVEVSLSGRRGSRSGFEGDMMLKQRVAMDILSRLLMLSAMLFISVIVLYWR